MPRRKRKTALQVEQRRAYNRQRNYGLTPEQFGERLVQQENRCGICRGEFTSTDIPHVDHDHESKQVRGLLCGKCNRAIGLLGDCSEGVILALRYLIGSRNDQSRSQVVDTGIGGSSAVCN